MKRHPKISKVIDFIETFVIIFSNLFLFKEDKILEILILYVELHL